MKEPARFHGIVFCTGKYKHTNTENDSKKKTGNQLVMPSASSPPMYLAEG
jgi:hypothetical protein